MTNEHYLAPATSIAAINRFTLRIREVMGLEGKLFFPIVHFIEVILPQLDSLFELEIVDIKDMSTNYAETLPSCHSMRIREDVYEGAIADNGRDRFTLAHEVGHYLMHQDGVVALARNDVRQEIPHFARPEWQANTFSAALLAPPTLIRGMSIDAVATACKVSLQVAEIQLSKSINQAR